MLDIDNKVFRNLPEQVLWNKEQIESWIASGGVAEIVELTPDPNVFSGDISQDIIDRISGKPLVFVFCGQDVYIKFSEGAPVINFLGLRISKVNHLDHTDITAYQLAILKAPKKWARSNMIYFETYDKTQLDDIINTLKQNSYQDVDTSTYPTLADFLATTGEEGYIYLYPVNVLDLSKGYMMYIWESSEWRYLGTTALDLSNYYNKSETDALLAAKANDSEVVKLTGDQTISGAKTFNNGIRVGSSVNGSLYGDSSGVYPNGNGSANLGQNARKWKEGYINKIIDNNGSYSSNNVLNIINASDIVNNTLTQEQYDLITNGKPTRIVGTILGKTNPILFGYTSASPYAVFSVIVGREIRSFLVNSLTKLIQFPADNSGWNYLNSVARINGKSIPAYPSDTTKKYMLVQQVGGTLAWEEIV